MYSEYYAYTLDTSVSPEVSQIMSPTMRLPCWDFMH